MFSIPTFVNIPCVTCEQHHANRENQLRDMMSLAAPYPAFEPFDSRSVTPWGESGTMTTMYHRWVQEQERQAREGQPPFRVIAGLQRRLDAFLKAQEIAIEKRYEEIAEDRRELEARYTRGIFDDKARADMMRDTGMLPLMLAEMRYVRDRREITYLSAYSRMDAVNFSMHSWMMARRRFSDSQEMRDSSEISQCIGEPGGFYKPITAFIWQQERKSLE